MDDIIVEVRGGVVQQVTIPRGCEYRVVIRDYDNKYWNEDTGDFTDHSEDVYLASPRGNCGHS